MLQANVNKVQKIFDFSFLLRYLIKFVVFYYLCRYLFLAWHGATDRKGVLYFAFVEQYFNFNVFIKAYLFQIPIYLAKLFSVHALQDSDGSLQVENGARLLVKGPCYGFGLMSFWIAFVLADSTSLMKKFFWGVTGIASLLIINSLRVTLLLIAKQNKWNIHLLDAYGLDHHTQFNIVAYTLIFLLMYGYYKRNKVNLGGRKKQLQLSLTESSFVKR